MDEKFEELYNATVKPNFEDLSFFWSYPYSDEFVQTILKENANEVELDNVKKFNDIAKSLQYAFYVWCVENNKI